MSPSEKQGLVDQDGRTIALGQLNEAVTAVTFFETDCSIICLLRLLDLASVVKRIPESERRHVKILALTVASAQDRPADLKALSASMKLDTTNLILASAGPEATKAILASIGWRADDAAPDRFPSTIFLFDRRGNFAMRYAGARLDQRRLEQDLTTLANLDRGVGSAVAEMTPLR